MFVLSANIHRRHMTKGQRAMAVAKIYPEPGKGGRGKRTSGNLAETAGFSQRRLQEARTILKYAPDLADNVLTGSMSLDEAYRIARERKDAASSDDARLAMIDDTNVTARWLLASALNVVEVSADEALSVESLEAGAGIAERLSRS